MDTPLTWILGGTIVIGVIGFFWYLVKLRGKGRPGG
jgi:hypothetical protein